MADTTTVGRTADSLPREFDLIRTGLGYTMAGWDFTREEIADAINAHRMLNPAIELGTNACPWNCSFCYTESPDNPDGEKRRLANEMTIARRLRLIDEAADLGARAINIVGAGEPTIDPNFWEMIERMHARKVTPILYTEGSLRLTDRAFVERLYALGVTIVFKVNSLHNQAYQNAIVAGDGVRKNPRHVNYTELRNAAIDLCIEMGFNRSDPTRLAFDTIVCKQNAGEIEDLHRYARQRNIFILLVNYLPSGRSTDPHHDALSRAEQFALFARLAQIDEKEFGLVHGSSFPYGGGTPCTIRGLGVFVKIDGRVLDCPGESQGIGDLSVDTLARAWNRVRHITAMFNGGCMPRELAWAGWSGGPGRRTLSIHGKL